MKTSTKVWSVILVIIGLGLILAPFCMAQDTNTSLVLHTPKGDLTLPLTGSVATVLTCIVAAAGSWLFRVALFLLPAAKPGTWQETAIKYIRALAVATPTRHMDDVGGGTVTASAAVGMSATEIVNPRPPTPPVPPTA